MKMQCLAFCLFLAFFPGIAQDVDDLSQLTLEELLNFEVVSATRSESKLSDSPIPISVITAKDIESSGLNNIPDILSRLGEIDILRVGRSQTEVSIRGKGINFNRRLLVLIDSRTEYNDLFGVTLWSAFPINIDDIERIEIVRGPASALFGANAFAGVINIITKSPANEQDSRINLHTGKNNNNLASLQYYRKKDKLSFKFGVGMNEADSGQTDVPFAGFNRITTSTNFNPDDESLEHALANLQLRYNPNEKAEFTLSAGFTEADLELLQQPGLPRSKWLTDSLNFHTAFSYQVSEKLTLQVNAYANAFSYDTPLVPLTEEVNNLPTTDGHHFFPTVDEATIFGGEIETQDISVQLVGSKMDGRFRWVAGGEYRTIDNSSYLETAASKDPSQGLVDNSDRDINSVFANFTYATKDKKWKTGLGYRFDDDVLTGADYGYTASLAWLPKSGHNLRVTARRAFRAPSLFEMFTRVDLNVPNQNHRVRFRGNQALENETIETIDFTYTGYLSERIQLTAEVYQESYDGLIGNPDSGLLDDIDLDPNTNLFTTTTSFQNLANADSTGAQLGIFWLFKDNANISANVAYITPDGLNDLSGETFFTPTTKVNIGFQWMSKKGFNADAGLHYVSTTDDEELALGNVAPDGPNFTRDNQESYTHLNLKLGYRIPWGKGLEIYAASTNLLGDKHVEYWEFDAVLNGVGEEIGNEIWGGLAWKF